MKSFIYISILVGILAGLASNTHVLAGKWENLILWAAVGIILGLFAAGRKSVIWGGLAYGLFMTIAFLISGFAGSPDKIGGFALLTAGLSIVGALGGFVTVFAGSKLRRAFAKRG